MRTVFVLSTCPDKKSGKELASRVLEERLAACVNILACHSLYWWEEEINEADEQFLIFTTKEELAGRLIRRIEEIHPYEVPKAVAIPIIEGSEKYLNWIRQETSQ